MEKNNLDFLGFGYIFIKNFNLINKLKPYFYPVTLIYHQPNISKRMYYHNNTKVIRMGDVIWNYMYKTELFLKSIQQIDDKILNTRMNCHEDFLLFFLLTRKAKSLKNIKRVFLHTLIRKILTIHKYYFQKKLKKELKLNIIVYLI